jgi:hypothetical protein
MGNGCRRCRGDGSVHADSFRVGRCRHDVAVCRYLLASSSPPSPSPSLYYASFSLFDAMIDSPCHSLSSLLCFSICWWMQKTAHSNPGLVATTAGWFVLQSTYFFADKACVVVGSLASDPRQSWLLPRRLPCASDFIQCFRAS